MKCFLVNPDYPERHPLLMPIPPLGLAYLAAVLDRAGHVVAAEDQFATRTSNDDLCRRILAFGPDLVGIGSLTPSIGNAGAIAARLRAGGYRGHIVMGNTHPTVFADDLLGRGVCDSVVRGEGEATLAGLAAALAVTAPLDGVPGLSFVNGAGIPVNNPPRPQIDDLDSLPVPAWHLFDLEKYPSAPLIQIFGRALPIQASRGCPEKCTFCAQEVFAPRLRRRSIESVIAEIDVLADRHGMEYFVFTDANFPPSRGYGIEFCRRYRKTRHFGKIKWSCELKVDRVDRELLGEMAAAGCCLIEYGVESGDQNVLRNIGKRTTLDMARNAMRITREAGIATVGLFMIGLPGEGAAEVLRTFRFAASLDPDMAKFNIAIPQPGSALFKDHEKELLSDFHPETYSPWYRRRPGGRPVTVVPGGLSAAALTRLQSLGMVMFYARPRPIARMLRRRAMPVSQIATGAGVFVHDLFRSLRNGG